MSARQPPVPVTSFVDKYGEERVIHRHKGELKIARRRSSAVHEMTRAAGVAIGKRIKRQRIERGMTLAQLCVRAGLVSVSPKSRMWEIENGTQDAGVHLGTLYALAAALGVGIEALMPPVAEVTKSARVRLTSVPQLRRTA